MFTERNDSFDFIAGLEEFKKTYRIERGLQDKQQPVKSVDLRLKEGEKITLKLNGISDLPVTNKPAGMGLKKLAPPPGQKKSDML